MSRFFHPTLATEIPPESMRLFDARLPVTHSAVMNADNSTHALCLRAKNSVPQETADKLSSLVKGDIKKHQAISEVAQISLVEIVIAGEESWSAQSMQERIISPRSFIPTRPPLRQYFENGSSTIGAVGVE